MLTTSSVHDAKQNSIKLTDTSELIPTQSVQEIDFFNNPPQLLELHRFPRHICCKTSILNKKKGPEEPTLPAKVFGRDKLPRPRQILLIQSKWIFRSPHHGDLQIWRAVWKMMPSHFSHYSPLQVDMVMTKRWYESHLWLAHKMMNSTFDLTWL